MTPNPPPAIRSPSQCVDACVRNLQMCADMEEAQAKGSYDPRPNECRADAYRQAIALIRSEFQGYLP